MRGICIGHLGHFHNARDHEMIDEIKTVVTISIPTIQRLIADYINQKGIKVSPLDVNFDFENVGSNYDADYRLAGASITIVQD